MVELQEQKKYQRLGNGRNASNRMNAKREGTPTTKGTTTTVETPRTKWMSLIAEHKQQRKHQQRHEC
jgi:hypothetical protein